MSSVRQPMETALKYLSRQSFTEHKLSSKLKTAGFEDEEVTETISRLKIWGYLNDREFGVNRIKKLQERLKSRSCIELDLKNNGISTNLINKLLDLYYPEQMEIQIARELLQKKTSSGRFDTVKLWSYLLRAGFSENTIHLCFPNVDPT